ncbi:hypothetical protein Glove_212g45 [Diversispora epigaea]|uniref:Transcription elongation factor 1 homolog n=1 Tax=Diversispora epigaea TaxID=1348612 RepID=A0A397IKW9_9GLOM|nr:hypothetical protein Glove_212g45 [Diversispora epigaea]
MGKRKTKRKPMAKRKLVLDTHFDCIFCHHEKSVDVKMNREDKVGNLSCRTCGAKFQSKINQLSDPVDVYSDWVDAAETVKPEDAIRLNNRDIDSEEEDSRRYVRVSPGGRSPNYGEEEDDDEEDF